MTTTLKPAYERQRYKNTLNKSVIAFLDYLVILWVAHLPSSGHQVKSAHSAFIESTIFRRKITVKGAEHKLSIKSKQILTHLDLPMDQCT